MKAIILAAALIIGSTATSFAHSPSRIDTREARQSARIHNGVVSGQLTRREAKNLRQGQQRIHRMEHRAKRDGVVTARERNRIKRAQNTQSRHIYNKRHNWR